MDKPDFAFALNLDDHRGRRRHRFMESADINTAFRELFEPLRANIRSGRSNHGQVYALEMDACIPGELLATDWIPPASRGVAHPRQLADGQRRRALFDKLYAQARPEQMFAYVAERGAGRSGPAHLYLEIVSEDACFAARYPIEAGQGWHQRELRPAAHSRLDRVATT
jgi:hypothetical protein